MAQFLTELVMDGVGKSIHSPAAEPTPAS
jgi:hypothetical protein